MPRPKKAVLSVDTEPNIRLGKDGKYWWEIERQLEDGSKFRKAGACIDLAKAVIKRDAAIADYNALVSGAQVVARSGLTVGEWSDQCTGTVWPEEIDDRTVAGYADILRIHVKPRLGDVKLNRLTYDHVADLIATLKADGRAVQTRKNVRNCLSKLYTTAQRLGKVPHGFNPAKLVVIKAETNRDERGNKLSHKRTLTPAEVVSLKSKAKGEQYEGSVYLGLYSGLRIGEIVGLTWQNVDLEKGMLRITQQRQRIRGKGVKVKDPKTAAGSRSIPISSPLMAWLLAAKEKAKGRYVITNMSGNAADANTVTRWFKEVACAAELCGKEDEHGTVLADPTPHDLRHTFCYYCANGWVTTDESGKEQRTPSVGLTTLSRIAGHSTIAVTAQYYVDTSLEDMRAAMAHVC